MKGRWLLLVAITLFGTALDQFSKYWAHGDLRTRHGGTLALTTVGPFSATLTFVRNPGAAWGLLSSAGESFRRPFFFLVSLGAIAFVLHLYRRLDTDQIRLMVGLALVLSGAVGNFIDRLRFGYVIDFIDLRLGSFRWPTFNFADVAITAGVGLLMLDILRNALRDRRAAS